MNLDHVRKAGLVTLFRCSFCQLPHDKRIHAVQQHASTTMTKEIVVDTAPKRIKYLQFGILSPQEIVAISEFEATQRDLYKLGAPGGVRQPAPNGVLDARLVIIFLSLCRHKQFG